MKKIALTFLFLGFGVYSAHAGHAGADFVSAFRRVTDVVIPPLTVPRVVEVPYGDSVGGVGVADVTDGSFWPYYVKTTAVPTASLAGITGTGEGMAMAADGNQGTYADFPVFGDEGAVAEIYLRYAAPVSFSSLYLSLPAHVALPNTVRIAVRGAGGAETIVVAPRRMEGMAVPFPVTRASEWHISLWHGQPLRIAEISLGADSAGTSARTGIRFLAQPKHEYALYYSPDHSVSIATGEAPDLADDRDVLRVTSANDRENPAFVMADTDGDGIPDSRDNCVSLSNPDQVDINGNGRGDVCDDFDKDGAVNSADNCPNDPNREQADTDADGMGDVCDGEESRFTEKYPWLPWLGIGSAAAVLIALFGLMAWSMRKDGVVH